MFFLNKRNLRVAEMMIEVTHLSTKLDEKGIFYINVIQTRFVLISQNTMYC